MVSFPIPLDHFEESHDHRCHRSRRSPRPPDHHRSPRPRSRRRRHRRRRARRGEGRRSGRRRSAGPCCGLRRCGCLRDALAGVDKLLLVSGSEVGQRLPQHTNIIDAAEATGVAFIAYTSILHAATSPLILAGEHKATEELLAASGIDHALLRNGWYWENYDSSVAAAAASGALFGSAGAGRVAGAARKDFAEAAAAVLTTEGHAGAVYELGGERLTYTELAEVLSGIVGVPVTYKDLPKEEYAKILENAGVPAQFAAVLADSDAGIAVGALDTDSGDLERLIGRPATPAAEAIGA